MKEWRAESHTADYKVIIRGSTYCNLFEAAYESMHALIKPVLDHTQASQQLSFNLSAPSIDMLLIDFLSEALYILEAKKLVITHYDWQRCEEKELSCTITAQPYSHLAGVSIKAITFHDLSVSKKNDIFQTSLVFDI